jgi:hypothetical protein
VAANRGHDFNVSLFERLVVGGTRHGALTVQHREAAPRALSGLNVFGIPARNSPPQACGRRSRR